MGRYKSPYTVKRAVEERIKLILADFNNHEKVIITGSLCGWGDVLIPSFSCVVELIVPTEIRIDRIRKRETLKFGDRILLGGDMYKNHEDFVEWASNFETFDKSHRSRALHDIWAKKLDCPFIQLDGTKDINELIESIKEYITE